MLLAIDIGNTNIVFGVFENKKLIHHWRIVTQKDKTEDEYGILIENLYRMANLDLNKTKGVIISSVVPPMVRTMEELCQKYFHITPLFVGPGIKTGMAVRYDNPHEVGADRIVNAVAAYKKYRKALVIIDFGTATTFDCVTNKGEYIGGVIIPGIEISLEALAERTAKLPKIELVTPDKVIGKNTISAIQSGIIFGYAGMVDAICEKIKKEMKDKNIGFYATGGLAGVISKETKHIEGVEPNLTLEGLKILYEMNEKEI